MSPPLISGSHAEFEHPALMAALLTNGESSPTTNDKRTSGSGQLVVSFVDGQSSATLIHAQAPLKLLVPTSRGSSVSAFTSTFGGGLVAGDHIALHIQVAEKSTLAIGTQSSTKVFRSDNGLLAQQQLTATVEDNALLGLLPDPVTCFAGSRYRQKQTIELSDTGSLLLIDPLTSGRAARDERWAFKQYESHNKVTRAGRRIVMDATRLNTQAGSPIAQRMGRFQAIATVLLLGPRCATHAASLLAWHNKQPLNPQADLLVCASPIADGVLLRLGANGYDVLDQFLRHHLGPVVTELFGDHWQRKP